VHGFVAWARPPAQPESQFLSVTVPRLTVICLRRRLKAVWDGRFTFPQRPGRRGILRIGCSPDGTERPATAMAEASAEGHPT